MYLIDYILMSFVIILALTLIAMTCHSRLEMSYHERLVSAIFRYRTQCYMDGIEPGFDLDEISRLPWYSLRWQSMISKEYISILEPYMEELKDDPRFY